MSDSLFKRFARERDEVSGEKSASGFASIFVSSPTQIWRSKISWRIALAAFMTIMLVQVLTLNLGGIDRYKKERLDSLREAARSAVVATLDTRKRSVNQSPFDEQIVARMLKTTSVRGFSVYSYKYEFLQSYGVAPTLTAQIGNLDQTFISSNGALYEVILKAGDLQSVYTIVVQIDASAVQNDVSQYVQNSLVILGIMSLLVTTVLMIAVGKWLLEPILYMRSNLVSAFKNPEKPEVTSSPYDSSDEIGAAIDLCQKLILQNAQNLNHIKSTAEDKIHRLAYYDSLTGLPNRPSFVQSLSEYSRVKNDETVERFAIISLDLDHFKDINDSMGHNVGDAILRSVGKKLRASLPDSAIVSRTGEDEFAVMMPLSGANLEARDVAERVLALIRAEPFKVFNEEFQVRASVGVSTFPDDSADPDVVLKNADIALNRAKENGRDTLKEYTEDFDRAVQMRFQMLRDLRTALEEEQLELYFQPQLCLKTGKVIGAEALLRWWKPHPSGEGREFISPAEFIPVAEQSGLIVPIGQWVLEKAARTAKVHEGLGIRFAVNVSGNQFLQGDICADLSRVLAETGIDPKMLELEVTESVFMDDIDHTVGILKQLHALGVELAIDDFGTGYSSLSYLSQFPIDRLKIDQSFIRNALNDSDNASIARTIINLGHTLNLKVIAEGVETKEHEDFLLAEGCDEVQGYRYSKPVPADEFVRFVQDYNGDLASFDS